MATIRMHASHYGIIAVLVTIHVSCSGTSSNMRMEQTSSGVTSGGNLAMVAVRSTAVAAVRQPVTTTKLGLAALWHRPREIVSANAPLSLTAQSISTGAPGTPEFEDLLDRMDFPAAESGKLTWLVDGDAFFAELDRQIAAARHSIHIQVYIFDHGCPVKFNSSF